MKAILMESQCVQRMNSEIIDENYDPSEFLLQGFRQPKTEEEINSENVMNDLAVSDSEEAPQEMVKLGVKEENDDEADQALWFEKHFMVLRTKMDHIVYC